MIIWNYIKIVEADISAQNVLKLSRTCNYTLDNSSKTTQGYQELQITYKLKHRLPYYIILDTLFKTPIIYIRKTIGDTEIP